MDGDSRLWIRDICAHSTGVDFMTARRQLPANQTMKRSQPASARVHLTFDRIVCIVLFRERFPSHRRQTVSHDDEFKRRIPARCIVCVRVCVPACTSDVRGVLGDRRRRVDRNTTTTKRSSLMDSIIRDPLHQHAHTETHFSIVRL